MGVQKHLTLERPSLSICEISHHQVSYSKWFSQQSKSNCISVEILWVKTFVQHLNIMLRRKTDWSWAHLSIYTPCEKIKLIQSFTEIYQWKCTQRTMCAEEGNEIWVFPQCLGKREEIRDSEGSVKEWAEGLNGRITERKGKEIDTILLKGDWGWRGGTREASFSSSVWQGLST